MMNIIMIDVEAGKEDLFERMRSKLIDLKTTNAHDKVKILYMARCYTHSDISIMIDVKDPEALPEFITDVLLGMDGVWDIQTIPLFNPNFFKIPKYVKKNEFQHFTITLDVKADKTKSVFKYLQDFAATDEAAISFLAYSFYSYDNDILLSLLAPSLKEAGNFLKDKIRSIDGVIDSFLWQIEKWQFIISHEEWVKYINYFRMEEIVAAELWDETYICAC